MSTNESGHDGDSVARRTKRLWTDEEKRSICFQTAAPGVSVAQVARRYAVNANLIFKWLRDPRFAPDPASASPLPEDARFLPVEIVTHAAPVFDDLEVWLALQLTTISGKSPLAAAIRYALTRMERLAPTKSRALIPRARSSPRC